MIPKELTPTVNGLQSCKSILDNTSLPLFFEEDRRVNCLTREQSAYLPLKSKTRLTPCYVLIEKNLP